jgi:hypothetical protein
MNYHIEYREDWKTCTLDDLSYQTHDHEADFDIIAVSNTDKIGVRLLKNRHGGLWTHDTLPAAAIDALHQAEQRTPLSRNASMYAASFIAQNFDKFTEFVGIDAIPEMVLMELSLHASGKLKEAA